MVGGGRGGAVARSTSPVHQQRALPSGLVSFLTSISHHGHETTTQIQKNKMGSLHPRLPRHVRADVLGLTSRWRKAGWFRQRRGHSGEAGQWPPCKGPIRQPPARVYGAVAEQNVARCVVSARACVASIARTKLTATPFLTRSKLAIRAPPVQRKSRGVIFSYSLDSLEPRRRSNSLWSAPS